MTNGKEKKKEGNRSGGPGKKHIRTTTNLLVELFDDAAFGIRPQYATSYRGHNGHDFYRQVNKDDCVNTSLLPKDNENPSTASNSAGDGPDGSQNEGMTNSDGSGQNRPGSSRKQIGTTITPDEQNNEEPGSSPNIFPKANANTASTSKLHALVQHIYAAQARVQLEATEIKKAEAVASAAQKSLEEASDNVRVITAALQTAQQEVATAAVRAQTAQLQLAAHDQLLFAARQKVDALSAQMVGLQAEDGIFMPNNGFNSQGLYNQLREPLPPSQTPTPIPPVDNPPTVDTRAGELRDSDSVNTKSRDVMDYEDFYPEVD